MCALTCLDGVCYGVPCGQGGNAFFSIEFFLERGGFFFVVMIRSMRVFFHGFEIFLCGGLWGGIKSVTTRPSYVLLTVGRSEIDIYLDGEVLIFHAHHFARSDGGLFVDSDILVLILFG